ncbi:alpha-ketoglutarate-dependent dioxygenase AlkB family protein [Mucilaginibacter agri]|uniref:Alpha-ketoglutarate-dependent dioxygenase AlkB n=1 Tax=Mucilaginibacter agri TaxID=2695265 RepID=A0A966DQG6_9SPHI|nr:alpha-ketoglutarate-dependent dioxygenase AlkB [Mucilaginibacter agri]NCD68003.1 alpha-ketoglutarate-dependent dioxygenase AlkB [Mucilaginibacter agri]
MVEQLCFFPEAGQSKGLPDEFLKYSPGLFSQAEGDHFLNTFIGTAPWKQTVQKMYDKELLTPRLTAWYGDLGTDYSQPGRISHPTPWTPELLAIKAKIEPLAGVEFNSVLLNYYRDGNDSVAWHSDKESILGKHPVIASVTFGQVRSFDIRRKADHNEKYSVRLEHGSFLLMKSGLQEHWEHRIAKSVKPMKPRVNLTFRVVM